MPPWGRDNRREARDEGQWRQFHGGCAIGPRLLELQPHDVVIQDLESVVGQGRTQDVFAQGEPALLVVGGDLGRSVEIKRGMLPA